MSSISTSALTTVNDRSELDENCHLDFTGCWGGFLFLLHWLFDFIFSLFSLFLLPTALLRNSVEAEADLVLHSK